MYNWKILFGGALVIFGIVDLVLYLNGYRDNTIIPKPVGVSIAVFGGIYLIIMGRREKK